jgi:hypothetical protein
MALVSFYQQGRAAAATFLVSVSFANVWRLNPLVANVPSYTNIWSLDAASGRDGLVEGKTSETPLPSSWCFSPVLQDCL